MFGFQAAMCMQVSHLICSPTVKGLKYFRLKSWTISSRSGLTCTMSLHQMPAFEALRIGLMQSPSIHHVM